MIMGPARLRPVSDCTANHKPVLSTKTAPYFNNQAIVRLKEIKEKNWSWVLKQIPTPSQTGRPTVGRNINDDDYDDDG
jgi:hypothetical protein